MTPCILVKIINIRTEVLTSLHIQQSVHKHCTHHIDMTLTWIGLSGSESKPNI